MNRAVSQEQVLAHQNPSWGHDFKVIAEVALCGAAIGSLVGAASACVVGLGQKLLETAGASVPDLSFRKTLELGVAGGAGALLVLGAGGALAMILSFRFQAQEPQSTAFSV